MYNRLRKGKIYGEAKYLYHIIESYISQSKQLKSCFRALLLLSVLCGIYDALFILVITSLLKNREDPAWGGHTVVLILVATFLIGLFLQYLTARINSSFSSLYRYELLKGLNNLPSYISSKFKNADLQDIFCVSYAHFHNNVITASSGIVQGLTAITITIGVIYIIFGIVTLAYISLCAGILAIVLLLISPYSKRLGRNIADGLNGSAEDFQYYLRLRENLQFEGEINKTLMKSIYFNDTKVRLSIAYVVLLQNQTKAMIDTLLMIYLVCLPTSLAKVSLLMGLGVVAIKTIPIMQGLLTQITKLISSVYIVKKMNMINEGFKHQISDVVHVKSIDRSTSFRIVVPPNMQLDLSGSLLDWDINFNKDGGYYTIFEDINDKITRIRVSGESGIGKSTFVRSLIGLDNKYSISQIIGGLNYTCEALMTKDKVAYIPQRPELFEGSWLYNITLQEKANEIDMQHLIKCLEVSMLLSEAEYNDPRGLTELLSSRNINNDGLGTSGGERQRILLTQAIYRRPQLLVIDEGLCSVPTVLARKISRLLFFTDLKAIIYVSHNDLDTDLWSSSIKISRRI